MKREEFLREELVVMEVFRFNVLAKRKRECVAILLCSEREAKPNLIWGQTYEIQMVWSGRQLFEKGRPMNPKWVCSVYTKPSQETFSCARAYVPWGWLGEIFFLSPRRRCRGKRGRLLRYVSLFFNIPLLGARFCEEGREGRAFGLVRS